MQKISNNTGSQVATQMGVKWALNLTVHSKYTHHVVIGDVKDHAVLHLKKKNTILWKWPSRRSFILLFPPYSLPLGSPPPLTLLHFKFMHAVVHGARICDFSTKKDHDKFTQWKYTVEW